MYMYFQVHDDGIHYIKMRERERERESCHLEHLSYPVVVINRRTPSLKKCYKFLKQS